ncbi:MAG TPA: aldehyde dehydrogenase family protein [Bacteroidetes bacterium]|nr:aldehyde dehydrogenase family protein [Bacteroidota bacterium]
MVEKNTGSGAGQTKSVNPATGELLASFPLHSVNDLRKMIRQAKVAQKIWQEVSVKERAKKIERIRDYLVENTDDLVATISADNGKSLADALITEIFPATLSVHYYCKNAGKFLRDRKLSPASIILSFKRSKVIRVPHGVVGVISPWNYPFAIAFYQVIIALLSGNGVILKTATETQLVGHALKRAIEAADLPAGLFHFVNMPGRLAGDAFLENGIDKLAFIGSVSVGKKLMAKAAATLTPVTLELGGKDAMIVCDDADPYLAANGAVWGGYTNAGQSCGGIERIYVHEKIYDKFMSSFKEKTETLKIGAGQNYDVDISCITTKRQVDTINRHVADALKKGAAIFAKSAVPDEPNLQNFLPAMVLTNVNHDMQMMREETFGPIVGVMKVKDMDEAIALANDSNLGLSASVWSQDRKKAEKIARKIEAGVVNINDHLMSHGMSETPWGGFKESGIGRSHSKYGFWEMTQPQVIVRDVLPGIKREMWWYPVNKKVYDGLRGLIEMRFAKSLKRRFKGIKNALIILPRMYKK